MPKCVRHFPEFFSGNSKANLQKSSDWWSKRASIMDLKNDKKRKRSFNFDGVRGTRKAKGETMKWRGCRRLPLVGAVFHDLREYI